MSNFSFDDIRTPSSDQGSRVSYFSLKNDGDSAVVRFMHDTVESFDVVSLHEVTINNKKRRVECIYRSGNNGAPCACPLCEEEFPFKQRMYVHLIEYVQDASGKIVPTPRVWDRPVSYAYKLRDFINNYGPLSDVLFTIKRNGAAGDQNTTYTEMLATPRMCPPENYPKVDFPTDFQSVGTVVMSKTEAEMRTFLETGNFPMPARTVSTNTAQTPARNYSAPVNNAQQPSYTPKPQNNTNNGFTTNSSTVTPPPTYSDPVPEPETARNSQEPNSQQPWSNIPQRPVRFY